MNLYAVSYWVPFPESEYGGLVIFAGESKNSVIKSVLDRTTIPEMKHRLMYEEVDVTDKSDKWITKQYLKHLNSFLPFNITKIGTALPYHYDGEVVADFLT